MNKLNARGTYGELKDGYAVAARFSAWAFNGNGRIEATTSEIDTYLLSQGGPFTVRLQLGRRWWVWREAEVIDPGVPFVVRVLGSADLI